MRRRYADGSSETTTLEEIDGGIYLAAKSTSGDKYRIVQSSGNLQLLDNDGLVRLATRLETVPSSGECGIK